MGGPGDRGVHAATLLGISRTASRDARGTMGSIRAAIALTTIFARWRGSEIKSSCGGDLLAMCERERFGSI